jgi:hypothetical protein
MTGLAEGNFPGRSVAHVTRGTLRLLHDLDRPALTEVILASGRRADIMCVGPHGDIWIIETKSGVEDFRSDRKWPEYRDYCDRFFFAVDGAFPQPLVPSSSGLILADAYGAELVRDAPDIKLAPARRRALLLLFARLAARRVMLTQASDPFMPFPGLRDGD